MDEQRDVFAYEPRRLTSVPVVSVHGYRIKPYKMSYPGREADLASVDAQALLAQMPCRSDDPAFHGLGFSILHIARDGIYQLLARWYAGNNLMSEAYEVTGDLASGTVSFQRLSLFACIWEMAVYAYERDCWVSTVMASGRRLEGAEAYLQCRLEGWV